MQISIFVHAMYTREMGSPAGPSSPANWVQYRQPARQLGVPGKLLHAVNYFAQVFVHCNFHLPRLLI